VHNLSYTPTALGYKVEEKLPWEEIWKQNSRTSLVYNMCEDFGYGEPGISLNSLHNHTTAKGCNKEMIYVTVDNITCPNVNLM
jgi:hypothetical protein